jgi:hypothetical protein
MFIGLRCCFGIALCAGLAVLLSILLNDSGEIKLAAPALCSLAAIPTTVYWGRISGIIGSLAASFTLAVLLFPPAGSLEVQDFSARAILILSQLGAIGAAMIAPHHSGLPSPSKNRVR